MIFKCKICGGELNVKQGQSIVECEYCGVKQTLPRFFDERTELMYDRANNYLSHNEFDKAENIYNQILLLDKEDADAYWDLVMCRYGVTYVKDPQSGKYIPTCNRTHYESVFNDENYKNAIKYADAEKAELYKRDARLIEDIQNGIIAISKHEKPFDIFISYKETDIKGARTKDSIKAQELYNKLTSEGYKVFFSRITLEDKIGMEYEPYIYAALATSKVMLVIGSSKDNFEAVWVKNEWSRYLAFARKDREKTLIPFYFNMDKDDLPEEFAHLPANDMSVDGFEQELIRGIKKLIPLPVMLLERRKKLRKKLKIAGFAAAILIIIGMGLSVPWFIKLPDYNAAMQLYYDKKYAEAAWAFGDLGDYRDSAEMKEACELSWRKSVAAFAAKNDMGSSSWGSYYITPNGTVEAFVSNAGNANEGINIDEHGKIVSISDNYAIYALHEDGYVDNSAENNKLASGADWEDIIQISPVFNATNVALRSDGTMVYGDLFDNNDTSGERNDLWLEGISTWDHIVDFECYTERFGSGMIDNAAIVGIRSDGTLEAVVTGTDGLVQKITYTDLDGINNFNDVKKIDICVDSYFNNTDFSTNIDLKIAALTGHDTIQTYINGEFRETDVENVVDVRLALEHKNGPSIYELHSDGYLYRYNENKYLLSDVVYLKDSYAVTRSGNIYYFDDSNSEIEATEGKTQVYSEWLERMN